MAKYLNESTCSTAVPLMSKESQMGLSLIIAYEYLFSFADMKDWLVGLEPVNQ